MKRVLITGANKGIGLATVKKLLESFSDTYVLLGSRDFKKGKQALETLLKSSPKFKERVNLIQLDVYSCSEFDPETIFEHIQIMKPKKIDYKFLDRENEFIEVIKG